MVNSLILQKINILLLVNYVPSFQLFIISMKISKSEIQEMAKACVGRLITEISTVDAYERFYKGKVNDTVWNTLMSGVTNMTPFHKAVLDIIVGTRGEYATFTLASHAAEAWNKSIKGQQFLTNIAKEGYKVFDDGMALDKFLVRFADKKYYSEAEYIDNGLVKLYEDDIWLLTCTTSYAASKKHYGDTHWCTASDIFGRYNGFNMFKSYVAEDGSEAILVQFVNKSDRTLTCQAEYGNGGFDTICDYYDKSMDTYDLQRRLMNTGEDVEKIKEMFTAIEENFTNLYRQTRRTVSEEEDYWNFKTEARIKKILPKAKELINSKEVVEHVLEMMKRSDYGNRACRDDSFGVRRVLSLNSVFVFIVTIRTGLEDEETSFFGDANQQILDTLRRGGQKYSRMMRKYYIIEKGSHRLIKTFDAYLGYGRGYGDLFALEDRDNGELKMIIDGRTGNPVLKLDDDHPWDIAWESGEYIGVGYYDDRRYTSMTTVYRVNIETGTVTEWDGKIS